MAIEGTGGKVGLKLKRQALAGPVHDCRRGSAVK